MRVGDDVGPGTPRSGERWSLADLASDVRVDAWRAVVAETHLPWRLARTDDAEATARPFDAVVRRDRLGELSLLRCRCDPCGGARGKAELRSTTGEYFGVLTVLAGREVVEQDGRQVELRAGEFAVWDSTRPARFRVTEPLHKRTLLVPRARLAALHPGFLPPVVARPRDATLAALFSAYVASVASCVPSLDDGAALAAGNAALELLAGAMTGAAATDRGALGRGLVAAVDRAIDRQLGDPDLSPGWLAAQHGISVRTLHLLFERRGETVSSRIRRLRLARARADLADPRAGSITDIATRWGFRDPTQFSRAFRRAFGQSPRDARSVVAPGPPETANR